MEDVVAAARRIEKVLVEQNDSKMERFITSMQEQIRILTKDLKSAHEQMAAQQASATPTAALATPPIARVAAAHLPPFAQPPSLAAAQPPPLATAQLPPYPPARHLYQHYVDEGPYFRPPHRQQDRRPPPASYVAKRAILSPTALLAPFSSAYCANKCGIPPAVPQEDKSWSCLRQMRGIKAPPGAFKLLGGSPEANVIPVGCAVGPPITGQLTLEGIPVLGLVDTGASITCLGFSIWWRYRTQWGPMKTVHGAHGKPLQIAGKTQQLDLQCGKARGRACFIVIVGLESPPCLIGMDIMQPLRVRIDVTNGTATPAQPDPQTVHLNTAQQQRMEKSLPKAAPPAAQPASPPPEPASPVAPLASPAIAPPSATPHRASRALLLQTAEIPAETARLVRCHNPWPTEDVYFSQRTLCRHL